MDQSKHVMRNRRRLGTFIGALGVLMIAAARLDAQVPAAAHDGCVACHQRLTAGPAASATRVGERDVHRARGFSCVDCHGGDPSTDDKVKAKDPRRGYRGVPAGQAIIAVCARCHSDPELMRRFAPRQRVDQASEYATSVHGKRLAGGDTKVATCVSCHGAHDVRPISDANSPVYPLNVAATCAKCHADPGHMAGYTGADGSPLPTTQRADYERGVHYAAMVTQGDLSAPTCNDCHGNHGAAPPGVGAVANVCGTCHAVFAARFALSPHRDIFERGCVECHSNHAVQRTSDDMLGGSASVYATCHSDDAGQKAADGMRSSIERLKNAVAKAGSVTAAVRNAGMEVSSQELALSESRTRLTSARTEIHTSSPAAVDPIVAEGLTMVDAVSQSNETALTELRYRRRGLAVSLGAILLVVVALGLKIRLIDQRKQAAPGPPQP